MADTVRTVAGEATLGRAHVKAAGKPKAAKHGFRHALAQAHHARAHAAGGAKPVVASRPGALKPGASKPGASKPGVSKPGAAANPAGLGKPGVVARPGGVAGSAAASRAAAAAKPGAASASPLPPAIQGALQTAMAREGTPPSWQDSLQFIMAKESAGQVGVRNPHHSARGLYQLTAANYGHNPRGAASFGDAVEEAQGGIRYIRTRYGTADAAADFWRKKGWF